MQIQEKKEKTWLRLAIQKQVLISRFRKKEIRKKKERKRGTRRRGSAKKRISL